MTSRVHTSHQAVNLLAGRFINQSPLTNFLPINRELMEILEIHNLHYFSGEINSHEIPMSNYGFKYRINSNKNFSGQFAYFTK